MTRREFFVEAFETIKDTGSRMVPGMRRVAWLTRILGVQRQHSSGDRIVALDASCCPACGAGTCRCVAQGPRQTL